MYKRDHASGSMPDAMDWDRSGKHAAGIPEILSYQHEKKGTKSRTLGT